MASDADTPVHSLLSVVLERVLHTECLALEGLRMQASVHNGLLGGGVEELVQAAEQRAYQRAETLLAQLLAETAGPSLLPPHASLPANDLR